MDAPALAAAIGGSVVGVAGVAFGWLNRRASAAMRSPSPATSSSTSGKYVPTQMEAPLPPALRPASLLARASYLLFERATNAHAIEKLLGGTDPALRTELGYGGPF